MARGVAFVGPLPPPVNGFSNICGKMLALLEANMPVDVFDRAPQTGRLRTLLRQATGPFRYFGACVARRSSAVYVALSGGRGQLIDMGFLLLGKLFRRRVYIHHHSFAYINAPSLLNRCVFAMIRRDTHIVLSRRMGEALVRQYGLRADGIQVVSNAAFYESAQEAAPRTADAAAPLQLGFLSNITFEKGFVEFFGILKRLEQLGVDYRAHIAGPLAPAARETFERLLAGARGVEYLGPLYGADKEAFYGRLDVFVFPTNYVNEAEPLVVFEAMRRGVYVIACDRGAISEMLCNGAGLAFPAQAMVESAAERIKALSGDRGDLVSSQQSSLQQAQRIRSSGRLQLETLLAEMRGGSDLLRVSM